MLNSTGSISTPQSSAPHSYNNATAQLEVQEKARFNQTLATIIRKVDALISNAVEDVNRHTHRPHHAQEFVKPLVGYFVSYYQLPALQLSPITVLLHKILLTPMSGTGLTGKTDIIICLSLTAHQDQVRFAIP